MIIKTSFKTWFNSKKTHVVTKLNRKKKSCLLVQRLRTVTVCSYHVTYVFLE